MLSQTAQNFHPEALKLFDSFLHGLIPRREFFESAEKYAITGARAEILLNALAEARQVELHDQRIRCCYMEYLSPNDYGSVRGLLAQPAKVAGRLPTVLVVHENRGLDPRIENIARRLALNNFIAFVPDVLGGYSDDEEQTRFLFSRLDQKNIREDFVAAVDVLRRLLTGNGKVGMVGFCHGGRIANFLAARRLLDASLLLRYAEHDERINAGWPAYVHFLDTYLRIPSDDN
ncbi:MAG: dienelactone hydrolase family protein [Zoogloeaceae bacterium]|nr:dienelactone hydrolase family protein [Zoogloeaceae bacterium]